MAKLFRPSNGTGGDIFCAEFCDRCEKDRRQDRPCKILTRTLIYSVDEPEYPQEWIYGEDGSPLCTAFVLRGSVPRKRGSRIGDKRQGDLSIKVGDK